jgi:hypothetical protein
VALHRSWGHRSPAPTCAASRRKGQVAIRANYLLATLFGANSVGFHGFATAIDSANM